MPEETNDTSVRAEKPHAEPDVVTASNPYEFPATEAAGAQGEAAQSRNVDDAGSDAGGRLAAVVERIDPGIQLGRVAFAAAFLLLWEWVAATGIVNPIFIGRPSESWQFLVDGFADGSLWRHIVVTMREAIIGFSIGAFSGAFVGLLLSQLKRTTRLAEPFLTLLNATPKVGLAPVVVLWFGIGEPSKYALAAIVVFFIVYVPCKAAARLVDPDLLLVARTLKASRRQTFLKVLLPGILPALFGALRLGTVYSLLAVVFGEMIASREGLGQLLIARTGQFDLSGAFAIMLLLATIAVLLSAIVQSIENHLLRWDVQGGTVEMPSL